MLRVSSARRLALVAAVVIGCVAPPAWAVDPADLPPGSGDRGALTAGAIGRHEHWVGTGRRPFVSALFDLGFVYARPTLALGYGEPHHRWFGMEGYADVSQNGATDYVGLHGATPYFSARMGLRYEVPTDQYFLTPRNSYTREDTELDLNGRSHYLAVEAELDGNVPFPGGELLAVVSGYGIVGTPRDLYVFEEALKVVVDPPFLWRGRLGYMASLAWGDEQRSLRLGGAAEVIHNPARGKPVVRLGPLVSMALTCHLDAVGGVMLVVASPDHLGLLGADFGYLGLRYHWATGDPSPGFP